jgi:hypothetical protein
MKYETSCALSIPHLRSDAELDIPRAHSLRWVLGALAGPKQLESKQLAAKMGWYGSCYVRDSEIRAGNRAEPTTRSLILPWTP